MIHWVNQHFGRWGRWVQLGHGRGSAGMSASWDSVGRGNVSQAIIPIKDIELSRTHDWVRSLPDQDQRLLLNVYCTPRGAREVASNMGLSLRTLYARLHKVQCEFARCSKNEKSNFDE